jgi:fructose-1,6-bisphosphatase I
MASVRLDEHPAVSGEVGRVILALGQAGRTISAILARGPLIPDLGARRGDSHGDVQKELDLLTDRIVLDALRDAPVRWLGSEERDAPLRLDPYARLAVAIDPLDGSSNIETNAPMGTIFSVLPAREDGLASFLRPGRDQLAAGFLIYGAHTAMVLTTGDGAHLFVLDPATGAYESRGEALGVPLAAQEYAINGSNERHWDACVRRFAEECRQGRAGPVGRDFNTRWIASLVAEAYRILRRGGVYLYPADARPGYAQGRLRLIYEANPVAWLIEEAGGAATDGRRRILDLVPVGIHQRVPLVFGAVEDVMRLGSHYATPEPTRHEPLFGTRSLFRGQGGVGGRACR